MRKNWHLYAQHILDAGQASYCIQTVTTMALINHGAHDRIAQEAALAVRKAEATGNLRENRARLGHFSIQNSGLNQ